MFSQIVKNSQAAVRIARHCASTLNIGVIGAGRIGQVHLQNLAKLDGVKIVTVADSDRNLAAKTAETFNVPKYTTSADDLINSPDINAVFICSPPNFHSDQILNCVKANKHVFCEKPVSSDLKKALEVARVVKASGIKMMVGFQRRFDPHYASLHAAIGNNAIGNPVHAIILSRDPSPPVKTSGGLFKDMAISDFDVASWIMNANSVKISGGGGGSNLVTRVYCTGALFHDKSISIFDNPANAIDSATVTMSFSSGATAIVSVCRRSGGPGYDQRIEVIGTTGSLSISNPSSSLLSGSSSSSSSSSTGAISPLDRYSQAYASAVSYFVTCIKSDKPISVSSVEDGVLGLKIAYLAEASLREKRMVDMNELLNV